MGSMGSIGSVNAEFTASTGNLTAGLKEVGERLSATAAKAQAAGEAIDRSINRNTVSGQRFLKMQQRQQMETDKAIARDAELARALELAALKADILANANERLGLSTNAVVAKFQVMSREVKESLSGMAEKVATVGEELQLSSDGIAAGFGAMGTALGLGIAGTMVGHFLDDTAESLTKVRDVAETTKIAISSLAGLQAIAQSKGLSFQPMIKGIQMMSAAQMGAAMEWNQASNQQVASFKALGITMKEVQHDSPEQMFYRLSKALHDNTDATMVNAAARRLFGRGATSLLPIFETYGAALEGMMKKEGALSGYTDKAGDSAERWLEAMKQLSLAVHSMAIPALEGLVAAIPYVESGFYAMGIAIESVLGSVANSVVTLVQGLKMVGEVAGDVVHLRRGSIGTDLNHGLASMAAPWHLESADIAGFRASMSAAWASRNAAPEAMAAAGATDLSGLTPARKLRAGRDPLARETDQETAMQFWDSIHRPSRIERAQERVRHAPLPPKEVDFNRGSGAAMWARFDRLNQNGALIDASNQHNFSRAQIDIQQKSGQMTAYQASVAHAAINAKEFADQMDILNARLAKINSITDSTLTDDQKALQTKQVLNEQAELLGRRQIQQMQEQYDAMVKTPLGAGVQGLSDYLQQFSGASISGRMAPQTLETANDSVARLMTTGRGNFAGMFRGIADMGAKNALGGIESHFLKGPLAGLLGKKQTLGTQSNPMWVRDWASQGATGASGAMKTSISSITDLLGLGGGASAGGAAGGAGGILSTIGGTLMKSLPFIAGFLATGGPVSSGLSYMVGEKGPELFTPGRSGTIIPNHALSKVGGGSSGGDGTINVDARGAMDPAATMAAVQRGIVMMGHQAVKQSMHSAMEMKARTPR